MGWESRMSTVASKIVKILSYLLKIIIIFIVVLYIYIYWYQGPRICMSGVGTDLFLNEELAISLSRQALKDKGIDISKVVPIPYWNDHPEKLFANDGYDPNSGYILWQRIDDKTTSYSVSVEKRGDKIYCNAGKSL